MKKRLILSIALLALILHASGPNPLVSGSAEDSKSYPADQPDTDTIMKTGP